MDARLEPTDQVCNTRFLFFGEGTTDERDPETFRARWWPAHVEHLTVEEPIIKEDDP